MRGKYLNPGALSFAMLVALAACAGCEPPAADPSLLQTRLDVFLDHDVSAGVRPDLTRRDLPLDGEPHADSARAPSSNPLRDFYSRHGYRPMWSDATGKLAPRAETLLAWFRNAGEHGLDPRDYAIEQLEALEREISRGGWGENGATQRADFDVLATSALLRYASDISGGRVRAEDVSIDWRISRPKVDLAEAVDDAVGRDDLAKLDEFLPPPGQGYERLRGALEALRAAEADGGWPVVPPGPKLALGSRGSRVQVLRQRLLGPSILPANGDGFDAELERAVRRFQALHGLDADGVAGANTLREMNVPVGDRIRQVELNLERWRWLPRALGDPHVIVNIPAFELKLVRNNEPVWSTRIVAGKAFTPTPVFSDRIVGIVVHPSWNVPESIAVNEYLPELRKDRNALARHKLRLLQGSGDKARELDPRDIDWKAVNGDHFPYQLRQDPGPENPLGVVKFMLTNDFAVYLHDTPAGHLFNKSERDLSHGCIRVENALQLVDQIADLPRREAIREALDQPEERMVRLSSKIPVHIVYWTAWVDDAGDLHFGPDIYGFDGQQWAALDRRVMRSAPVAALAPRAPA